MYSLTTLVLVALAALLIGAALSALASRQLSADTRKQRELERTVERLSQQQKDHQHELVEHFTDAARLLNNLAESYRDVHNHLAQGSSRLTDNFSNQLLRPLPDGNMTELSGETKPDDLQQPLDYAPRTSPYETGTLNEAFGLEKTASNEEKVIDFPPDIPLVEEANGRN